MTRIISVGSFVTSIPFDMGGPYQLFAGQPWDHLETLLVRVQTEDGLVGWGEAFGHVCIPATRTALDTVVAPLVLGQNAEDISGMTRHVLHATHLLGRNGNYVYAFSGVEMALWDLLGKRAGLPLHQLLGSGGRETLPAYASLLHYGDADLAARNARAAVDDGYQYVKLHETSLDAVRASRELIGDPQIRLMMDVNCAWEVPAALDMAHALGDEGLYWLEEPVWPPEDVDGLARVRTRGIRIAAGENTAGPFGFKALIDAGAIDIAQPSVTKIGGIGEMLRVMQLCAMAGIEVVPHSPYFGPGFIATLHLAACLPQQPPIEVLWMQMDANPFDPWIRPQAGRLRIPDGPGLGCDPNPDQLEKCRVGQAHINEWRGQS